MTARAERSPERPARDGRPAGRRAPAGLRQRRRARAALSTALAREGVVFESAYCASPLCAPSRSALLPGRRPSAIGAYDNAAELPAGTPTIAHVLRAAGYETTLAGKMHFVGPDQLHGFEERLTTDVYPSGLRLDAGLAAAARRAARVVPQHRRACARRASREAALQTDYDDEVCFRAVQKIRDLSAARRTSGRSS